MVTIVLENIALVVFTVMQHAAEPLHHIQLILILNPYIRAVVISTSGGKTDIEVLREGVHDAALLHGPIDLIICIPFPYALHTIPERHLPREHLHDL